jgi:hypothetical protein
MHSEVLSGQLKGRHQSENPSVFGYIIKVDLKYVLDLFESEQISLIGPCAYEIERPGSVNRGEFLDYLSNRNFLKKKFSPCS